MNILKPKRVHLKIKMKSLNYNIHKVKKIVILFLKLQVLEKDLVL